MKPRNLEFAMTDSNGLQNQNNPSNDEQYLASLPPGYRFLPTDLELVEYLQKKAMDNPLPKNRIWNIDVYSYDPDLLTGSLPLLRETKWYFFSTRKKKYLNGNRPDRATPGGFWKPTGADADIRDRRGQVVGKKRVLEFYKGTPKGKEKEGNGKTNWKMHEYVLLNNSSTAPSNNENSMLLDKVVLCKIYQYNPQNESDPPRADRSNLQEEGSTSSSTCKQKEDHPPPPPPQPELPSAYGSHFGQPMSFAPATNNIAGSSSIQGHIASFSDRATPGGFWNPTRDYIDIRDCRGEVVGKKIVLGFYNGKPKERNQSTKQQLHNLEGAAGRNLQEDGNSSSTSTSCEQHENHLPGLPNGISASYTGNAYPQGGHFGQPMSSSLATDIIASFSSEQYQGHFPSTQHNLGPSNENHQQASLVSGLGVTGFAPTTNNIAGSSSRLCQESFPLARCNMEPSNPYKLAHLQLAREFSWFETTENIQDQSLPETQNYGTLNNNLDQDQTPIAGNVNQLPSNLHHHSTPLKPRSAYPQGSHVGQPISLARPTDNISGCSSGRYQESFNLAQFNPEPYNQYHQLELADGFTGFGTTDNNSNFPELCRDQSLQATQHYGPENYNLDQGQTSSSVTGHHDESNVNHSEPGAVDSTTTALPVVHHNLQSVHPQGSHLGHRHRCTSSTISFAAATNNMSGFPSEVCLHQSLPAAQGPEPDHQKQTPSSVTSVHEDNNVDQLPSSLHHHSTSSVAGAVDKNNSQPTEHQMGDHRPDDDYLNALASDLQDPNLTWIVGAFVNQNGKG